MRISNKMVSMRSHFPSSAEKQTSEVVRSAFRRADWCHERQLGELRIVRVAHLVLRLRAHPLRQLAVLGTLRQRHEIEQRAGAADDLELALHEQRVGVELTAGDLHEVLVTERH